MKRSAIAFISIALYIFPGSTVSAALGDKEREAGGFFAPTSGLFNPHRDATSDTTTGSSETPSLLKQIGMDFRNVFTTKENLFIVGAGLGAAMLASPYDEQIPTSRFNSELFEDTSLDGVFEPGQVTGGALVQVGAAIGIMSGRTVTIGRGRARFALSPMVPPGGGVGVQATLLPRN